MTAISRRNAVILVVLFAALATSGIIALFMGRHASLGRGASAYSVVHLISAWYTLDGHDGDAISESISNENDAKIEDETSIAVDSQPDDGGAGDNNTPIQSGPENLEHSGLHERAVCGDGESCRYREKRVHHRDGPAPPRIAASLNPVHPQITTDLAPWAARGGIRLEDIEAVLSRDARQPGALRRVALVGVIGGRLIMDYESWGANRRWAPKLADFAAQLSSVLRTDGHLVPDVLFLVQVASVPYQRRPSSVKGVVLGGGRNFGSDTNAASDPKSWPSRLSAPVFSMAKSPSYVDVLYPNPYFGTWDKWHRASGALLSVSRATPWASKARTAFWRGSCVNWPGSKPRVDLVLLHNTRLFDVAFTRPCPVAKWPPVFSSAAEDRLFKRAVNRLPKAAIVSRAEFARYKYLFHMPGSTHGSYSRNLQIVLGTGSVVLKWENPYYEFFYSSLVDGTHVVTVNATTAASVVARLAANDAEGAAIAAAARQWFATHLRGSNIRDYWVQLLRGYAALQRFKPELPVVPCSCDRAVARGTMRRCKVC